MIYGAVLDSRHRRSASHCRLKSLWISELSGSPFVDGVEFFTNHSWVNPHCGIRPFVVPAAPPLFPVRRESGAWVILNVLQLFLKRSKAAYLFVIDDSAHVRAPLFAAWLKSFFDGSERPPAIGFCYEIRDYFRMMLTGTGVLVSRPMVQRVLELRQTWDVMCRCELRAEEALGHVLMEAGAWLPSRIRVLGRPFANASDYEALRTKDFSGLADCRRASEKTRVCDNQLQRFADIVAWNGVGGAIGADQFLEQAEEMMDGVPADIGVAWTKTNPWLCRLAKDFSTPVERRVW
jgi:hypothetical protein